MDQQNEDLELALQLIEEGDHFARAHQFEVATQKFQLSLELYATAEGYTCMGWMEAEGGRYENAISLCHSAISIDPHYGNPYNDIGAYLIALGQYDEAVVWLNKAKHAPRYDARHFPCLNLGRLYFFLGEKDLSIEEFESVLEFQAGNEEALNALSELYHPDFGKDRLSFAKEFMTMAEDITANPYNMSFN